MFISTCLFFFFFFFNDTATTEIYTLSLHDALPIGDCALAAEHWVDQLSWLLHATVIHVTCNRGLSDSLPPPCCCKKPPRPLKSCSPAAAACRCASARCC